MFRKKASSVQIARPKPEIVHGIEIKKQPVGRYFEVLDQTGALVMELLDTAFPGLAPKDILEQMTKVDTAGLRAILVRVAGEVPRKLVSLLRSIVGADSNPNWDELTPAEMTKVVKAFWELNDMSAFFGNARSAVQHLVRQQTPLTGNTGSKG